MIFEYLARSLALEDGIITKISYEEGTCDVCPVAHSSLVNVHSNTGYIMKLEILQNKIVFH